METEKIKQKVKELANKSDKFSPEDFAIKALKKSGRHGYYEFLKRKHIEKEEIQGIAEYFGVSEDFFLQNENISERELNMMQGTIDDLRKERDVLLRIIENLSLLERSKSKAI